MAGNKVNPIQLGPENVEAVTGVAGTQNLVAWSWGENTDGQLGISPDGLSKSSPVSVTGGHSFVEVSAGKTHNLIRKADGSAWAWGSNSDGQLGNDDSGDGFFNNNPRSSPVSVVGGHSFAEVSAGDTLSFGRKADGTVWGWGFNSAGQVGDGTTLNRSSPVSVVDGHSFVEVSAGSGFGLARKSDGSAWAWGNNASGNLGIAPEPNDMHSPVSVTGSHSFTKVFAGDPFGGIGDSPSAGLKSDGALWTWGPGTNGQIGDGSSVNRSSPVSVIGGHSFTTVAVSDNFMVALKADGSAWAWGLNDRGQLGQGNTSPANINSPVSVIGAHSFTGVAVGTNHAFGVKADGSTWGWGSNTTGELGLSGINDVADKSSPVSTTGAHSFLAVTLGNAYTVAAKAEGSAGAGTARTIDARLDNRRIFTNAGSSTKTILQLPSASAGVVCALHCEDVVGIRGVAAANDVILAGSTSSASGGFIESSVPGSFVLLVPRDSTSWVATTRVGSWEIDSAVVPDRFSLEVEANVDTVTVPNQISASESGKVFTNEGSTADNEHDLPAAASGLTYTFVVQDATNGIKANAAAGDTIRFGSSVSASGGNIDSGTSTKGNVCVLIAVNSTEWFVTSLVGTWTIT